MTNSISQRLSRPCFEAVTAYFQTCTGIALGPDKLDLVEGRLRRLFGEHGDGLNEQVQTLLAQRDPKALALLVDALVTNETQFFREAQHFEFLTRWAQQPQRKRPLKVWSAACSSGEEVFTIAMVLADAMGPTGWSVWGTDISHTMVARARRAVYPMPQASSFPPGYLQRFALKGEGRYEGLFLMDGGLRQTVTFDVFNLNEDGPAPGPFDVIFLRNMLIYFDDAQRHRIVLRVLRSLAPGGVLLTGHAESLSSLGLPLRSRSPAVYERA
ncbi:MAG: hypothetical protein RIS44_506 [Pseudomonadota bacterium]|jgi:chemotaxis protein methyltransferase CheR